MQYINGNNISPLSTSLQPGGWEPLLQKACCICHCVYLASCGVVNFDHRSGSHNQ